MKSIGPSFIPECLAAGVTDFRFGFGPDGCIAFGPMPQPEIDKVQAVYDAHNPATVYPTQSDMQAGAIAYLDPSVSNGPSGTVDPRKLFIAKAISDEAYRLNVAPAALTGAQLSALRSRLAAIYKAL